MIGRSLSALTSFAALALALHAGSAHARVDAPAEIAALDALRDAYRERGGTWVGYATANSGENRRLGFHRILEGLPPFALQWHADNELRPIYRNAAIFDLAPVAARGEWTRTLHPEVLRYIQHGDGYFGLPVGIHGENWAWFNNAMLTSYGVSPPMTGAPWKTCSHACKPTAGAVSQWARSPGSAGFCST